uniref:Lectin n=2 Tax=Cajanus cajan TaxID=3821 RepID=A0A151T370_CAJCA|nr:Lectin [Cajanus cajan]
MYSILLLFLSTFLFLSHAKEQRESFYCFDIERFEPNHSNLIFQGDAQVSATGVLEVTQKKNDGEPVNGSVGRVLYSKPFHIWNRRTNMSKNFVTKLSFAVRVPSQKHSADGIAFFIAPRDSVIPNGSVGGLLGLFGDSSYSMFRQTFAVEFDTCFNEDWDPRGHPYHIGVDVNSVKSDKTVPWELHNGEIANVTIWYNASTNYLGVTLIYDESDEVRSYDLGHTIDLKSVVPEWVQIGISASVGTSQGYLESHEVYSWSFHAF